MELTETMDLDEAFWGHVSLWHLLTEETEGLGGPYAPGVLVEAIEKMGLTGFDRVGRWKQFKASERQSLEAIGALEWFYEQSDAGDPWEIENRMLDAHPLYRYGWPISDMPPLADLSQNLRVLAPAQSMHKELNSSLHLIGCLAGMLLGKAGCEPHPAFDTQEKILEYLSLMPDRMSIKRPNQPRIRGVQEGTAKKKIREGLIAVGLTQDRTQQ